MRVAITVLVSVSVPLIILLILTSTVSFSSAITSGFPVNVMLFSISPAGIMIDVLLAV